VLDWSADAGTAAIALIGSVVAVLAGDLYADALQRDVQSRHRPGWRELRATALDHAGIPVGALPILVLFVLAWIGRIETGVAATLAVWAGVALLGALGFMAARLRRESIARSLGHAATLALVGVVVLLIKTLH
jgi:hypothetical protein